MNLCFAETTQERVVFLRQKSWWNQSQVSEYVKMLALSFKRWLNAAIESYICFAVIKRPRRYFMNNKYVWLINKEKCSERNCMLKENSKNMIQSQVPQIEIN